MMNVTDYYNASYRTDPVSSSPWWQKALLWVLAVLQAQQSHPSPAPPGSVSWQETDWLGCQFTSLLQNRIYTISRTLATPSLLLFPRFFQNCLIK